MGLYLSNQEGAHHWLTVLTDLNNRSVKDILIACVNGLKGFPEAIETIYPDYRGPALPDSPDLQIHEVRGVQEPEGLLGRSEVRVQGGASECRRNRAGRTGDQAGRQILDGDPVLAQHMADPVDLLQIPGL